MSKEVKQNCQRMIDKLQYKLQELQIFIKSKKSHIVLQKFVTQIINDFKFFHDEFNIITHHLIFLQNKSHQKDILISNFEKELLSKNAQKKIIEQMMKSKYEKLTKQHKFLQFVGKNNNKAIFSHQRCKSELIKKGLSQLQKDIVDNNRNVCSKVKQLQNQIQNEEQRYLTIQNSNLQNNLILDINISSIAHQNNCYQSPVKIIDKKDKFKSLQLNIDDNITAFKTKKKQLSSRNHEQSRQSLKQKEPNSSQTVVINKKKKQQLAELIAQQTKIFVSRQKYFSTDI